MKLTFFLALLAAPAAADPCVSSSFDRPFPGATGVATFVADVPSVRFPAFWQTGFIDDYRYRLFSNKEGDIRPSDPGQNWNVEIACGTAGQSCDIITDGQAPSEVLRIADAMGQCLQGLDVAEAVVESTPVEDISNETDFAPLADVAIPQPTPAETACGTAVVNEATDVAIMQRLMILLGEDPGPVDGFLGPASFKAMDAFVDDANWGTSITDVIALLDTLHCERSE